ncbi:MAG: hypothetical protein PVH00_13215 [Gemmatimonadota bacterium]|jgi:hypothetical protein
MGARIAIVVPMLLVSAAATAQTVTLDEGTFRVRVGGRDIGTETFMIRQSGAGENATILASGRTVVEGEAGSRELEANLEIAGTTLRPAAYNLTVEGGDEYSGRLVGRRMTARIISPAAENVREYLVSQGATIIDEAVAHQYYFLARRVPDGGERVPIVEPRQNRQTWATVTVDTAAPITVAGETVAATRFRVTPAGGGDERTFWTDARGRVLRLEIPARQLVVERTAVPH